MHCKTFICSYKKDDKWKRMEPKYYIPLSTHLNKYKNLKLKKHNYENISKWRDLFKNNDFSFTENASEEIQELIKEIPYFMAAYIFELSIVSLMDY